MSFSWRPLPLLTPAAVLTPCIGVCELTADGLCRGCLRNSDEIARWSTMSERERRRVMEDLLPQRGGAST